MAYLDDTGLAYFWGKIKAYIAALLAPKANDADVVHIAGSETITGRKSIKVDLFPEPTVHPNIKASELAIANPDIEANTVNNDYICYSQLVFLDKDGTGIDYDGRVGYIGYHHPYVPASDLTNESQKYSCIGISCASYVDNTSSNGIYVGYDKNNVSYSVAPSTSTDRTTGTDILTRDWIPKDDRIVHITGTEYVTGTKIMTDSSVHCVNTGLEKGTVPSSNEYYNISFFDKNGFPSLTNRFGLFETAVNTNNKVDTYIVAYKNEANSTMRTSLGVVYDTNNNDGYGYVYNGDFRLISNKHYHQYTSVTKGTAPNSTFYNSPFIIKDVNGNELCCLYHVYDTNKASYFSILVDDATSSSATGNAHLGIGIDSSGNAYTRCPHPSADSNTNNIATTSWVRSIINKSPTEFRRKYTGFTRGTAPSSDMYYWLITGLDNAERVVSGLYGEYTTSKLNSIRLMIYKGTDTSSDHVSLGIGYDSSGNWYTTAPTPANSSNDNNIATTAFVKNQDYVTRTTAQTITGTKTFTNNVVFDTSWSIRQKNTNSSVGIFGGTGSGATDGAKLILNGKDNSSPGQAMLQGTNGSSTYKQLIVRGDTIYFNTTYCTFANNSQVGLIRDNKPDGNVVIFAGSQNFDGAGLTLNGRTYSTSDGGKFFLRASTMSSSSSSGRNRTLTGTPDGSIYWNGQAIQTSSDERLKRDFASVDDAVLDGWGLVDWMQFRFKDAFAEKGDAARYHVGLVSQRVDHAFDGTGVDVKRYGIVCHELQEDYYHDNLVIDAAAYTDEEGVFHEEVNHVEKELVPGRDEWTVRYTEALCMEAAYMRRENARLKKRVADLEDRLAALELRLGSE